MTESGDKKQRQLAESEDAWRNLIGIQFAIRGMDKSAGLNCYGLVREVYRLLRIELPARGEGTLDETLVATEGKNWKKVPDPVPYGVCLMRNEDGNYHLGVITPEMEILHSRVGMGVVLSRMNRYADFIVGYYVYNPGGGEDLPEAGGDNPARTIGSLLVAIAATVAAVYTYGVMAPEAGAAWGAFFAGLAAAAVSTAGNMIVNAVFPLAPSELPQLSGLGGDLKDSQTYTWGGVMNQAQQGLAKPWIFGRIIAGGQVVSEKTWFDGAGKQYLDMLICPAGRRITRFDDIRINDTPYSYFLNTVIERRYGDDEQTLIPMFEKIYRQFLSGAKLPYDSSTSAPTSSVAFVSKNSIGGARLTLSAPGGLWQLAAGVYEACSVACRLQYRKSGESGWTSVLGDATPYPEEPCLNRAYGAFNGPEESSGVYALQDEGTGGGPDANFSSKIALGADFQLIVGETIYYCTQTGYMDAGGIYFFPYTDAARTLPFAGEISDGPYSIQGEYISGVAYYTSPLVTQQFVTNREVTGINFRLISYGTVDGTANFYGSLYKVYYQKVGESSKHYFGEYRFGRYPDQPANGYADIAISGLDPGNYIIYVHWTEFTTDNYNGTRNQNAFAVDDIVMMEQSYDITIAGNDGAPNEPVTKTVEVNNLPAGNYYFRLWRTTVDQETISWQDDVYLRDYSEVIDVQCAYPNHPLLGIRAMATDRLSGARPKITSVVTGEPLSVPAAAERIDTTVADDEGLVSGTGQMVNNVLVDGLRKLIINAELVDQATAPDTVYWLVFMASAGFAQVDRPLTKYYQRIVAWEVLDGTSRCYVHMTESVSDGAVVMVFHESVAPTRNTAWAVAKMLLIGSQGRVTIATHHWPYWEEWNAWNEELVWNDAKQAYEKRHVFDAVIDFQSDLWSISFRAAATARATLVPSGGSYRPVIDKARNARQVFGDGNSAKSQITMIPKKDRPNIVVTTFLDEDDSYKQKSISEEDVQEGEYPIVKTIPTQIGICRESHVRRLLRYMLKQNRYVMHAASLEAGPDAIECEVGDAFLHASKAKDLAVHGRIKEISGANCILDCAFTPEAGEYRLSIWGKDAIYTWQGTLTGENIQAVPCPTGFSMPEGMYEYPYMLTKLTAERTKYTLLGVRRPVDTMHSEMAALEYRDEVYADD